MYENVNHVFQAIVTTYFAEFIKLFSRIYCRVGCACKICDYFMIVKKF